MQLLAKLYIKRCLKGGGNYRLHVTVIIKPNEKTAWAVKDLFGRPTPQTVLSKNRTRRNTYTISPYVYNASDTHQEIRCNANAKGRATNEVQEFDRFATTFRRICLTNTDHHPCNDQLTRRRGSHKGLPIIRQN